MIRHTWSMLPLMPLSGRSVVFWYMKSSSPVIGW